MKNSQLTEGLLWVGVFVAAMMVLGAWAEDADDQVSLSFGLGASNVECGTGIGSAYVRYDNDHDVRPAHLLVESGPNGSCSGQGTLVDAQVAWNGDFGTAVSGPWTWQVVGAYDQRVVPFEYQTRDPGKLYRGVEVVTVSALVGACREVLYGQACLRFDAIEQDYETPNAGGTSPFSLSYAGEYKGFEVDATWLAFGDQDLILDLGVTRDWGGFEFGASASVNPALLDNPAPARLVADDGTHLARLGGPRVVYRLRFGRRL